jgi:hypothetical protein
MSKVEVRQKILAQNAANGKMGFPETGQVQQQHCC